MVLKDVLFVVFLGACWLYCLVDAAITPSSAYRGLSKAAWVAIIAATFIVGAIAWSLARSRERSPWPGDAGMDWAAAEASFARHPAGRYRKAALHIRPKGPDDDPEFLHVLDRIIHGTAD